MSHRGESSSATTPIRRQEQGGSSVRGHGVSSQPSCAPSGTSPGRGAPLHSRFCCRSALGSPGGLRRAATPAWAWAPAAATRLCRAAGTGTSYGSGAPLNEPWCCKPGLDTTGHLHERGSTSGSAWPPDVAAGSFLLQPTTQRGN